jgi:hypothetical protein
VSCRRDYGPQGCCEATLLLLLAGLAVLVWFVAVLVRAVAG